MVSKVSYFCSQYLRAAVLRSHDDRDAEKVEIELKIDEKTIESMSECLFLSYCFVLVRLVSPGIARFTVFHSVVDIDLFMCFSSVD